MGRERRYLSDVVAAADAVPCFTQGVERGVVRRVVG
jgi:hypothetical protein